MSFNIEYVCAFKDCDNTATIELAGLDIVPSTSRNIAYGVTTKKRKTVTLVCEKHFSILQERDWREWLKLQTNEEIES